MARYENKPIRVEDVKFFANIEIRFCVLLKSVTRFGQMSNVVDGQD